MAQGAWDFMGQKGELLIGGRHLQVTFPAVSEWQMAAGDGILMGYSFNMRKFLVPTAHTDAINQVSSLPGVFSPPEALRSLILYSRSRGQRKRQGRWGIFSPWLTPVGEGQWREGAESDPRI